MALVEIDVAALVKRLDRARCWSREDTFGSLATKWFDLDPADVSLAARILESVATLEKLKD